MHLSQVVLDEVAKVELPSSNLFSLDTIIFSWASTPKKCGAQDQRTCFMPMLWFSIVVARELGGMEFRNLFRSTSPQQG